MVSMDGFSRDDYFPTHKCNTMMFLSKHCMQIAQITMISMYLNGNSYYFNFNRIVIFLVKQKYKQIFRFKMEESLLMLNQVDMENHKDKVRCHKFRDEW